MTTTCILSMVAAIAIVASTTACGQSHPPSDGKTATGQSAAAPAQSSATSAKPLSCDDYTRLVSQCIETKMPESERAEARADLATGERMRKAFPIAGPIVEQQCAQSLTYRMRQDDYGCYAEEAVKRGVQTACTIVTRAEIAAIVQKPVDEGVPGNQKCTFAFTGNVFAQPVEITVHWKDGKDEVAGARMAKALVSGTLGKQFGKGSSIASLVDGGAVEGVGDEAYFTMAAIHPMLVARLGDVAVGVEGVDQDQLVAIAKLALPRVTPDPSRRP